jgi:hypothetical protein
VETLTYLRGKGKVLADYKFNDIYQFYQELYKEKALPKSVVKEIYKKLFPAIVKMIVFDNLDYRMPARLGYLRVRKKLVEPKLDKEGNVDARNLSVDWKKTKRYWKKLYPDKTGEEIKQIEDKPLVRETNDKTGGYRMSWYWDKLTCNIKNQSAYYVNLTRDNDRILSNGIKYNHLNFYM